MGVGLLGRFRVPDGPCPGAVLAIYSNYMRIKLSDRFILFAFFGALVALYSGYKSSAPGYRDAPADFSDISLEQIRSQAAPVPAPAPAEVTSTRGAQVQRVAIYGDNTLADYYRVSKPLQQLADSVVAIVDRSSLVFDEETRTYSPLKLDTVGDRQNFAADADFYDQKKLAFCSGSLVSGDLVLTAGHCVSRDPKAHAYFKSIYVVFGWRQSAAGQYEATFNEDQVYEVETIVVHKLASPDTMGDKNLYQDYSLIRLAKAARDREPLVLDRTGEFLLAGNKVFLAGYPMGMSVKITDPDDATIREIGRNIYTTDLDAFGGNSGGPVFDSYTRRITGVVVTANAKQFKYTLHSEVAAKLSIDSWKKNRLGSRNDDKGPVVTVSKNILKGFAADMATKGIVVDERNRTITFPSGLVYYNNEFFAGLLAGLGARNATSGEPVRLPAYEGIGTGVQRIDALIEAMTPLTGQERRFCESISARIQAARPVLDPRLMSLYRLNRCDKGMSI